MLHELIVSNSDVREVNFSLIYLNFYGKSLIDFFLWNPSCPQKGQQVIYSNHLYHFSVTFIETSSLILNVLLFCHWWKHITKNAEMGKDKTIFSRAHNIEHARYSLLWMRTVHIKSTDVRESDKHVQK